MEDLFQHIMQTYKDEQLIANYLRGDGRSLEVLIKRYLKSIYSFVYQYTRNSQDAQDITQEVFIKVWRSSRRFDQKKSFKTWIFSIAKNTAIDFFRKKKAIPFSVFENAEGNNIIVDALVDTAPIPDELFEQAGIARMLNSAMDKLSLKYRMVLSLHYNDHFTFREISEILEESINTVKTRHRRGIVTLRKFLKEK
ncbi:sigma-70 family RNA polymerase sigma factor [bacterium]|nr:MAG: sigma-70 family RNA polymerase sigma factor [bacterium]